MADIKAYQLNEGQTVVVRGKLEYSRLMSLISGEELARSIAQQRQNGVTYPTTKEHTRVVLRDVQVVNADQNNPTLEEQYVQQKCYNSKKNPEKGLMFSLDNKSPFLPPIWVPTNPQNLSEGYTQLSDPEGELDNGLDVSLVLETFKAGANANLGLGLASVVVNEAPRYYSNNRVDRDKLAAMGIVFNSNPVTPTYNLAPVEQNATEQSAPAYTNEQGLPAPGIGQGGQQQAQPQQAPQQPTQNQGQQSNAYAFPQAGQPQQNQPQAPAQNQGQAQSNPYAFPQAAQSQPQQNQQAPQNQSDPWGGQPQQPAQPQQNPNSAFQQPQTDPWTGQPLQGGQNGQNGQGGITYN